MKKILILTLILIPALFSCSKSKKCNSHLKEDCAWFHNYDPVCGCDGKTYSNSSEANCYNVDVVSQGECPK